MRGMRIARMGFQCTDGANFAVQNQTTQVPDEGISRDQLEHITLNIIPLVDNNSRSILYLDTAYIHTWAYLCLDA
jgi:hypothetical protein